MVSIQLESYELEVAHVVGHRRHSANEAKRDAPYYDRSRMEDNLTASIAAAACEMGVAKALGRYWAPSAWDSSVHHKHLAHPDVAPNIEVRRVREPGNPLVVRSLDVSRGRIMVSAYAHRDTNFSLIDVTGWLPATEAWRAGSPAYYDADGARLVNQSDLNNIIELIAGLPVVTA